jgi:glucose-6-phosphate dehydrogenase assembly protein OpcA
MAVHSIGADIGSIEQELRRLWREQAQERHAGVEAMLCARTLNLVVYAEAGEESGTIARLLEPVTAEHPGRTILVQPARGGEAGEIVAEVSASLVPTQAKHYVGRELISLRVGEIDCDRLQSLITPLLVPDLPVFLWWRAAPELDSELFCSFTDRCDRVIVDSARLHNSWEDLPRLGRGIRLLGGGSSFTDLAWSRLTSWRQLSAQFFDSPELAAYLGLLRRVVVEYGAGSEKQPPAADAILYAAWLSSRLGWKPASAPAPGYSLNLARGQEAVSIQFRPRLGEGTGLAGVLLAADEPPARFRIRRTSDQGGMATSTEVEAKEPVRRTVRGQTWSEAESVSSELRVLSRDRLFEEALAQVEEMRGKEA